MTKKKVKHTPKSNRNRPQKHNANINTPQTKYIKSKIFLHSTQHIAKISCQDASWFEMLVESSPCCTNNEQKRTQMMNKKLPWMSYSSLDCVKPLTKQPNTIRRCTSANLRPSYTSSLSQLKPSSRRSDSKHNLLVSNDNVWHY